MNPTAKTKLAPTLACALLLSLASGRRLAAAVRPPQIELTNGPIRIKVYLPDATNGFYRGTRFDWSGVIASLEYQGHSFYGPWFDRVDAKVHDYQYRGAEIVASTCSGAVGPVEEFQTNGTALGFKEAKVGGTFIKIGVGVLRKDEAKYDFVKQYEIVNGGEWTVKRGHDYVEFTQKLVDPTSGYGYLYRKTLRLAPGKPEMTLEHRLENIGRLPIRTSVYDHNFLVLDKQPPGPDFSIKLPFTIHPLQPPPAGLAEIRGNQIVFLKVLEGEDVIEIPFKGFGASARDNEIRIENGAVGAGMTITGDHPLAAVNLWSIRSVMAMEPFISMDIPPGGEFTWKWSYRYYTLPAKAK